MSTQSSAARPRFVGEICDHDGRRCVRDPYRNVAPTPLEGAQATLVPGTVVAVEAIGAAGPALGASPLALAGSARAELYRIAWQHGLDPVFPDAVEREVAGWLERPGIDDPALVDLTHLPFVTIDGASSRDLDQALHVAREGEGFCAWYALADASYYVRPGSALFAEALRRGASFYLPGLSVPMLPRALSEGLVSLNPDGPRRALTMVLHLDRSGRVVSTDIVRARVRSRAKLSFGEVQRFADSAPAAGDAGSGPLAGTEFASSLLLLRELGRLRIRDSIERGVVRYHREEVDVGLEGEQGLEFAVLASVRGEVELWNEQISLLCNREGARFLKENPAAHVQPIYRVHPSPDADRLEGLGRHLASLAGAHGLDPAAWCWSPSDPRSLAEFLGSLPTTGPHARVARAVQRQAIMVNVRSGYATEAAPHHGVGAEAYARFSAPMREIVGVFVHKETTELLDGHAESSDEEDVATRERVVESANRAREAQRQITNLANRVVLDRLFSRDASLPRASRPVRPATVVGLAPGKVHVQFDSPPVDVKLYTRDLEARWGCRLALADGVSLRTVADGSPARVVLREGDALDLRVEGRDEERDRWVLAPL
jgi:ribonuclease R